MRFSALVALTLIALLLSTTHARADVAAELGGTFQLDFSAGADTLLELTFEDGSTQEIKAGNGVLFALGVGVILFDDQPHTLETVFVAGLKYSSMVPAENAGLDFLRVPVELLAFYRNERYFFRVGGGAAYYAWNSMTGSGDLVLDVSFDPAFAGIVQADFIYKGFFAGFRYTILSLKPEGADESAAANSMGVGVGYFHAFGRD